MEPEPLTERYRRHVGDGAERRPPPLLAPVIAAVAALVAGWGVAEVGAAIVTENGSEVVAAFVAVAYGGGGLALLTIGQRAHGAAGATALAVSVPLALGFLFLTTGPVDPDEPTLVLALSTVLWGALHLSGPTRGRPLFLTLALAGAWLSVLLQVGLDVVIAFSTLGSPVFGVPGFSSDPNTATTGLVSLLFGTAYVGGGYLLHREGLAGTATPFAGVGSAALAVGALTAAVGRSAWVAGALFLTVGGLVAFVGARTGRRWSTWAGAAGVAIGLLAVGDAVAGEASAATSGVVLVALGSLVVLAAPLLDDAMRDVPGSEDGPPSPRGPHEPPEPQRSPSPPEEPGPRRQRPLRAR